MAFSSSALLHVVLLLSVNILLQCNLTIASPDEDFITYLPLYGVPPFPQWSGYLDASASTSGTFLHYWFLQKHHHHQNHEDKNEEESQSDVDTETARTLLLEEDDETPVILWLNGGPGSSSVIGLLQEIGPLLIQADGNALMENPYAWTSEAHLLVLESPAGVGYSYCSNLTDTASTSDCYNTDESTAQDAMASIVYFFQKKFPELKNNPFYITGESYAGVYIPTLTKALLDYNKKNNNKEGMKINLKGIAVGDPCTDNDSQRDSMDMLWYGHKYGMVPDHQFDLLWNQCKMRHPHPLTEPIVHGHQQQHQTNNIQPQELIHDDPKCIAAYYKYLLQTSNGFAQRWNLAYINDKTLFGPSGFRSYDAPGTLKYFTAQYMRRDDVKRALHVDHCPKSFPWPDGGTGWIYIKQYNACNKHAQNDALSMIDFYRDIIPKLDVTLIYNGDTDPCVSYEGTRTAVQKIGLDILPGGSYRPWFFNATAAPSFNFLKLKPLLFGPSIGMHAAVGSQLGGHVVNYEHGLTFSTVHGSGHLVPQFRPRAALQMLRYFLFGENIFAPLLDVDDEELSQMTSEEFRAFLDEWTIHAKSSLI